MRRCVYCACAAGLTLVSLGLVGRHRRHCNRLFAGHQSARVLPLLVFCRCSPSRSVFPLEKVTRFPSLSRRPRLAKKRE
jgi:hypothetical protein